jgi:histidine triad (HIT) family protein
MSVTPRGRGLAADEGCPIGRYTDNCSRRKPVTAGGVTVLAYDPDNIFAKILRGQVPAFRVYEDEHTLAFMDVMPQSDGHTLVLPKAPAENIFDLDPDMAAAVIRTGQKIAIAVKRAFNPDGITLMQFNGPVAGQTVFHFHLHVVPRYADQPLRSHGRKMADSAVLEGHARRIREAL